MAAKQNTPDETFPATWRWDEHGRTVHGVYVRMDEAATDYGRKPIIVLDVDGEERSVWLFDTALVSKFQDQLGTRPTRDFTVGERIRIERGEEKVESAGGRRYWPYRVKFPDAPKRSASDILGVDAPSTIEIEPDSDASGDDEIPF
jgi:hypothetical protein